MDPTFSSPYFGHLLESKLEEQCKILVASPSKKVKRIFYIKPIHKIINLHYSVNKIIPPPLPKTLSSSKNL